MERSGGREGGKVQLCCLFRASLSCCGQSIAAALPVWGSEAEQAPLETGVWRSKGVVGMPMRGSHLLLGAGVELLVC